MCTVADVREYLDKLPGSSTPAGIVVDTTLGHIIERVQSVIERYIRHGYEGYVEEARTILGYGSGYLILPVHELGSVSLVTTEWLQTVPADNYKEDADGNLYLSNTSQAFGVPTLGYYPNLFQWLPGRYLVTAGWGWGPVPKDITEVAVEITANIWKEKDKASFSDAIGVDTGGQIVVGYQRGLTNRQEMILKLALQQYQDNLPTVVG
jgi:hypothetical protein